MYSRCYIELEGEWMMEKKVRIIQKKDTYSMEYDVGDVMTVDSVWYGGEADLVISIP